MAECESPIEQALACAMVEELDTNEIYMCLDRAGFGMMVFPQHPIGPYRLDFLIECRQDSPYDGKSNLVKFAVECDGHDYHERTKEQAKRDRERDRYLIGCGVPTLRFTGMEINADARKCAKQVIAFGISQTILHMPHRGVWGDDSVEEGKLHVCGTDNDPFVAMARMWGHCEYEGRYWTTDWERNYQDFPEVFPLDKSKNNGVDSTW